MNSLLKSGILAWRSETSRSIVNNKDLLSMVRLMEEEVPRNKLYSINFTENKKDERFQADIAAFDETGKFLNATAKKSADKRLWLSRKQAEVLKQQIETDYEQATSFNMAQKNLSAIGLVSGGTTLQAVHNDDHTPAIPKFWRGQGVTAESGSILYGLKDDKENRCKIHFARNNEREHLKLVNVYSGMAVFYAGWVLHAGANHGGRNASTRLYVDLTVK